MQLGQDLRYGFRCMRRNPGFTAVAVLSLALSIGANTAIFSLIDALLLRSLPVREPEELIHLKFRGPVDTVSYTLAGLLAERREIFSNVGAFNGYMAFPVGPAGAIRNVRSALVTGGYYRTLGLNPQVGRLLAPEDDRAGAPAVAVISDGYWERQFARKASAVGETIRVDGHPVTIVGVTPAGFTGAAVGVVADLTMPVAVLPQIKPEMAGLAGPGNFWLIALARVKDGMSRQEASARLAAAWPEIAERAAPASWPPDRRKGLLEAKVDFQPGGSGWTYLRSIYEKPLLILMGVVALVLLIACANVANLLLARASARRREIAIRLATGAGRPRIIRQLLTESGLLAATGAALGIALAALTSRALVRLISSQQPIALDVALNRQVLGFTALVAIATALLFGLAPAVHSTAMTPSAMLKDGGRGRSRLLPSLVTIQVALSLLLLIGAGLFMRTLRNLQKVDPGFRREGVLLVELDGRRSAGARELVDAVRQIPGVVSAAVSTHTPLNGSTWSEPVARSGQPLPKRDSAVFVAAGPGYFETLGIPILAGRGFSEQDGRGSPWPSVVDEELARRLFNGVNPVGQRLSAMVRGKAADLEIVGVARNTAQRDLRAKPYPTVYVPYAEVTAEIASTLVARASGSLAQVSAAIQKAVQRKLPESSIEVRTLASQVEATIAQERMMGALAGGFGALALTLAGVGLYGLLNYSVARRTREIGIRMALGAQRSEVVGMEARRAVRLVAAGLALGLPGAWAASRWVESLLFGLTPTDPATIAGAGAVLLAAALAAAYAPARRASEVDPTTALRHE